MCATPSNWRSAASLPDYLREHDVVAVEGVDTRALVRHVRDHGAQRAVLSTVDVDEASLLAKVRASEPLVGQNLAATVSCAEPHPAPALPASHAFAVAEPAPVRHRVVAYDCGAKRSILQNLVRSGCDVNVVPWDTPAEDVLAMDPDGVFLSNGPGDPEAVEGTYSQVQKLLGRVPVFGICLGHQMIAKAAGAGHREAQVRSPRRQPPRHEPAHRPRGDHGAEPRLRPAVPQLGALRPSCRAVSRAMRTTCASGRARMSRRWWTTSGSAASASRT